MFSRKNRDSLIHLRDMVEQLSSEANQFERFFDLSRDINLIIDPQGIILRANKQWTRTLGWSAEETEGQPFRKFLAPEDEKRTMHKFVFNHKANDDPADGFVNTYLTKDGREVQISWRSSERVKGYVYTIGRVLV